ncbi:MAG: hypothetical protein FJY77_03485 [Candidatus Altiarchaeales archaeon]|nr:hypothetical protein [Candidatus Altiarchaeales archaeon]
MTEGKLKVDWGLLVLALLVGLFAGALFFPRTSVEYANVTCPSCENLLSKEEGLSVIYLYPVECGNCDVSRVKMLADKVGVPFMAFVNDAVGYPNILVTRQDKSINKSVSTIARASNDYNVVATLCLAGNKMACNMKESMATVMQTCLEEEGVSLDSVVYYYSDWCGTLCNNMESPLEKIEGKGFKVLRINEKDNTPEKECLKDFLNYAGGFPQLICPSKVISNTGALSTDGLEQFAEECGK